MKRGQAVWAYDTKQGDETLGEWPWRGGPAWESRELGPGGFAKATEGVGSL